MSRCKACDTIMNEYELKKIDANTGKHLDLCGECARHSDDALMSGFNETYNKDEYIFDKSGN